MPDNNELQHQIAMAMQLSANNQNEADCPGCDTGLKVTKTNGRTRIEIPENFGENDSGDRTISRTTLASMAAVSDVSARNSTVSRLDGGIELKDLATDQKNNVKWGETDSEELVNVNGSLSRSLTTDLQFTLADTTDSNLATLGDTHAGVAVEPKDGMFNDGIVLTPSTPVPGIPSIALLCPPDVHHVSKLVPLTYLEQVTYGSALSRNTAENQIAWYSRVAEERLTKEISSTVLDFIATKAAGDLFNQQIVALVLPKCAPPCCPTVVIHRGLRIGYGSRVVTNIREPIGNEREAWTEEYKSRGVVVGPNDPLYIVDVSILHTVWYVVSASVYCDPCA